MPKHTLELEDDDRERLALLRGMRGDMLAEQERASGGIDSVLEQTGGSDIGAVCSALLRATEQHEHAFVYGADAFGVVAPQRLNIQQPVVLSISSPGYSEIEGSDLVKYSGDVWSNARQDLWTQGFAVLKLGAVDLQWEPSGLVFGASVETPAEGAEIPQPTQWEAAVEQIRAEREAFESNKEQILVEYGGEYVAILGGRVIDHDADYGRLASRVYRRLGRRAVLLTRATREREIARVGTGLACT